MLAEKDFTSTLHETQFVIAERKPLLSVRYYLSPDRNSDKVYLNDGLGFFFADWLRATEQAVKDCITFNTATNLTQAQVFEYHRSAKWLWRCGVRYDDDAALMELRDVTLPLLHLPADSPLMARRCEHCGSRIWGREAILTGLGSECRRATKRARKQIAKVMQA